MLPSTGASTNAAPGSAAAWATSTWTSGLAVVMSTYTRPPPASSAPCSPR